MAFAPFVPLRVFSAYTMLEGAIEPKALGKYAKGLGFPPVAVTDRNGRFGVLPFGDGCRGVGVPPLMGLVRGLGGGGGGGGGGGAAAGAEGGTGGGSRGTGGDRGGGVGPASGRTVAGWAPVRALSRLDLPALGAPTTATRRPGRRAPSCWAVRA